MIRVLVVDDEPIARAGIITLLGGEADVRVIGQCRDGLEAVALIRAERPDLLFLDVQMPELTGFEVLSALETSEVPVTVFVTAYDQYARDAFEASAVDYLLKPFDRARFARALARARRFLAADQLAGFRARVASVLHATMGGASSTDEQHVTADEQTPSSRNRAVGRAAVTSHGDGRIMIRTRGRITFVALADIEWVEASRNQVRVRVRGEWQSANEPLASFATRVDPLRFMRVSRTCMVNLERVREFRRLANGQYTIGLDDGQQVTASRRYAAKLALFSRGD